MTTLAFDGKTFAADKQSTCGSRKATVTKVWKITPKGRKGSVLLGVCGNVVDGLLVKEWVEAGMPVDDKPVIEDVGAIVVTPTGRILELDNSVVPIEIEDSFIAIGSGGNYAMGAMAAGKSAVEAVEIAGRFDPYTGRGVTVVELDDPVGKPKVSRKRVSTT
jgi:ATP-dependent protease HslVU (ClpYQ) peptidase subunit